MNSVRGLPYITSTRQGGRGVFIFVTSMDIGGEGGLQHVLRHNHTSLIVVTLSITKGDLTSFPGCRLTEFQSRFNITLTITISNRVTS